MAAGDPRAAASLRRRHVTTCWREIMDYLTVGLLAFVEFWFAYPVAYNMELGWLGASLVIAVSSSLGAVLAIWACSLFRDWIRRMFPGEGFIARRTRPFMNRYGTIGIGLLSPVILGPILTSVGGIVLGAETRQLSRWIVIGIWAWAVILYTVLRATGGLPWLNPAAS